MVAGVGVRPLRGHDQDSTTATAIPTPDHRGGPRRRVAAGAAASCAPLGARATGARLARMQKPPRVARLALREPAADARERRLGRPSGTSSRAAPTGSPRSLRARLPWTQAVSRRRPPRESASRGWGIRRSRLRSMGIVSSPTRCGPNGVGPVDFAGPKRFFPPLLAIRDLPPLDAVLISHDHYDHLTTRRSSLSRTVP